MEQTRTAAQEAREIDEVIDRLTEPWFPGISQGRIRAAVTDAHDVDGRPIRDFVPVFGERAPQAGLRSTPEH